MALKVVTSLRTGLKESAAVVRAMGEGKHFLTLQRVQSEEFKGHFPLTDLEFFLLPNKEGGDSAAIRPEFQSFLEGPSDHDSQQVTIRYKAQAEDVAMIMGGADLGSFSPWHIWNDDHLQRRLQWSPTDPMFLLTCKVVRLDPPLVLPWKEAYDGASPWVAIDEQELAPVSFEAVVDHKDFLKVALDVKKALAEVQKNPIERPAPPESAAPPPKPPPPPPKPPVTGGTGEGKDAPAG